MKVLVTGGAGFIGSHLVEELVRREDKVTVLDNLSEGFFRNLKRVRNRIVFLKRDIRCNLPENNFDVVYHLAAKHSVPKSFNDPQEYFDVNVGGSWDVFSVFQGSRIVNISSSSAKECKSPYAISKRTTELCAKLFPNIVSLRYFNVFGERQRPTGCVVPAFCRAMLEGERAVIYGDGTQSRDYTYVGDVVRETIEYGNGKKKRLRGVFDIGYGDSHTTEEMFKLIATRLNNRREPRYEKERLGDVQSTRAKNVIEKPEYGFEKGLKKTVSWFREEKYKKYI